MDGTAHQGTMGRRPAGLTTAIGNRPAIRILLPGSVHQRKRRETRPAAADPAMMWVMTMTGLPAAARRRRDQSSELPVALTGYEPGRRRS